MRKIVVTGASGLIGWALTEEALNNGDEVYAFTRCKSRLNGRYSNGILNVIEFDMRRKPWNIELPMECDIFYHLAWDGTGKEARDNGIKQANNIVYTLNAVELAKKCHCKKFIFAGSQAEYGLVGHSIDCGTKCDPLTMYGICKHVSGKLSRKMCDEAGIIHVWCRIFSVYGSRDRKDSMISYACRNLCMGKDTYFSSGNQMWDYLYSTDAGRMLYLIGRNANNSLILPVANGRSKYISEYVHEIMEVIGCNERLVHFRDNELLSKSTYSLNVDMGETDRLTGFYERTSFNEGIKSIMKEEKMSSWKSEQEAREQIKGLVSDYYHAFKENKKPFKEGDRINYSGRVYDENDMMALTDATLDFWLTSGRFAEQFEERIAKLVGVKYAHLVNSGSSANLVAFTALTAPELGERQIKKGDEVITVAAAFPTTVAPIIQYGAVPVFIDVTIPQYNIDCSKLEEAYSEKTKAVFLAHTLGNPIDLKTIKEFCDKHNLWLIEDNCDALGSKYTIEGETRLTGAWGDISTCSFYPPHHITLGEGGCVLTDNPILNKMVLSFRDWGRDCICPSGKDNLCGHRFDGQFGELPQGYDHKYVYSHFGYNLKATDMQAAVGCSQLDKFPSFVEKRKANYKKLYQELSILTDKLILPEPAENSDPSWFGFLITIKDDAGKSRNEITQFLEGHNIQTRLLFSGNIIKHPCFDPIRETDTYKIVGSLENTDRIMENSFWIGVYPGMTGEMIDYMARMIKEVLA